MIDFNGVAVNIFTNKLGDMRPSVLNSKCSSIEAALLIIVNNMTRYILSVSAGICLLSE